MKFITHLERCERIIKLTQKNATGTPSELADRLSISKSTLYQYIRILKKLGADIQYNFSLESYVLYNDFDIKFGCTNVGFK